MKITAVGAVTINTLPVVSMHGNRGIKVSDNICLYCPEPALSLEHIIPAALGEFQEGPLLRNRICKTCNNALGLLDEQMVRSGPEAFIRRYYNITGRPGHDSVNPFYR